jgi:hypothetical protein
MRPVEAAACAAAGPPGGRSASTRAAGRGSWTAVAGRVTAEVGGRAGSVASAGASSRGTTVNEQAQRGQGMLMPTAWSGTRIFDRQNGHPATNGIGKPRTTSSPVAGHRTILPGLCSRHKQKIREESRGARGGSGRGSDCGFLTFPPPFHRLVHPICHGRQLGWPRRPVKDQRGSSSGIPQVFARVLKFSRMYTLWVPGGIDLAPGAPAPSLPRVSRCGAAGGRPYFRPRLPAGVLPQTRQTAKVRHGIP